MAAMIGLMVIGILTVAAAVASLVVVVRDAPRPVRRDATYDTRRPGLPR